MSEQTKKTDEKLIGKFIECQTISTVWHRAEIVEIDSKVIRVKYKKQKKIGTNTVWVDQFDNIERKKILTNKLRILN